jgi:transcription initiation factor TFIIIB Brf1 subunit/transcription initiation factor TFIIB
MAKAAGDPIMARPTSVGDLPVVQTYRQIYELHERENKEILNQLNDLIAEHRSLKENPFYNQTPFVMRFDRILELNNRIQKNLAQMHEQAKKALDWLEQEIEL